ncbi:hypothetical protein [Aureivirga marina]|uniref:hypothetical protein n=1 Tax=Aureivirga marina TaxID=1182451 RepID=UPI0018C9CF76|nr:hypothetical protein [Aureivirga marina]
MNFEIIKSILLIKKQEGNGKLDDASKKIVEEKLVDELENKLKKLIRKISKNINGY